MAPCGTEVRDSVDPSGSQAPAVNHDQVWLRGPKCVVFAPYTWWLDGLVLLTLLPSGIAALAFACAIAQSVADVLGLGRPAPPCSVLARAGVVAALLLLALAGPVLFRWRRWFRAWFVLDLETRSVHRVRWTPWGERRQRLGALDDVLVVCLAASACLGLVKKSSKLILDTVLSSRLALVMRDGRHWTLLHDTEASVRSVLRWAQLRFGLPVDAPDDLQLLRPVRGKDGSVQLVTTTTAEVDGLPGRLLRLGLIAANNTFVASAIVLIVSIAADAPKLLCSCALVLLVGALLMSFVLMPTCMAWRCWRLRSCV